MHGIAACRGSVPPFPPTTAPTAQPRACPASTLNHPSLLTQPTLSLHPRDPQCRHRRPDSLDAGTGRHVRESARGRCKGGTVRASRAHFSDETRGRDRALRTSNHVEEQPPNDFESLATRHARFPLCDRCHSRACGGLGCEHLRAEQRLPEGLLVSGRGGRDALPCHRVRPRRDLYAAAVRSPSSLVLHAPAVHCR